jgi:iron(II)-dependent oxidoreductase
MTSLEDKHYTLSAAELAEMVTETRRRTLALVADLDDDQLSVPLMEIVNPFRWELGHTAFFYEVFLLRVLDGIDPLLQGADNLYNSFTVEHDTRWGISLPTRAGTLEYMERVSELTLARLARGEPNAAETYLYLLAVLHEDMHGEAFTYMRQTVEYTEPSLGDAAGPEPSPAEGGGGALPGDVDVPGGVYQLGATPDLPFVFDNEKWAHPVDVEPFEIARAAVTNGEFAEFVEAGGYLQRDLWDYEGWVWRMRTGAQHPIYWTRGDGGWQRRHFDRLVRLEEHAPVAHITWYEADAYCTWAGRRLPTEAEWDMAASAEPDAHGSGIAERKRRYPWGDEPPESHRANLDSCRMGCADVGAYAAGDSAFGCRQMVGNVWEWTASPFYPLPGYVLDHPYKEYSAPWFGYRKVLKGGAWATRSRLACNSYRNFFQPYRNDILAGFRTCAA